MFMANENGSCLNFIFILSLVLKLSFIDKHDHITKSVLNTLILSHNKHIKLGHFDATACVSADRKQLILNQSEHESSYSVIKNVKIGICIRFEIIANRMILH